MGVGAWFTTAFDFVAHLERMREFSARTFGPGARVLGVCDHIEKELREVVASNGSPKEWTDVIILGIDGAWRSGATSQEIARQAEAHPGLAIAPAVPFIIEQLWALRKHHSETEGNEVSPLFRWINIIAAALTELKRSGLTAQQVVDALIAKQNVNEARRWPDWRTMRQDQAIEHDRTHDLQVGDNGQAVLVTAVAAAVLSETPALAETSQGHGCLVTHDFATPSQPDASTSFTTDCSGFSSGGGGDF